MELRITIGGLCMFVPQFGGVGEPDYMHVLLPQFKHGHHHAEHRHIPVLEFDTAYLRKDSSAPDGLPTYVRLRGLQWKLEGSGADMKICPHIVNLKEVTQKNVDKGLLGEDPNKKLVSRITLGTGQMTHVAPGVCWTWGSQLRSLAHMVRWTVKGLPDELPINLIRLHAGSSVEEKNLKLHQIGGIINLFIHHVPPGDLPLDTIPNEDPMYGFEPEHFSAFYDLFGGPVPVRLPRYSGKSAECLPSDVPTGYCEPITQRGGSPFTCMITSAPVE